MSQINVNTITGKDGGSAVNFPNGITVTGVVTATSLSQNISGNVTATSFIGPLTGNADTATSATTATTAGALGSGATGADLTLSGNLTVNGTTTTIDTAVTAVDSLAVDGNVTALGNLGVGTATAGNALHVFKNGDGQTPVLFETSNATGKLRFYNDSNGWSIDSEGELRFVSGRTGSGAPTILHIDANGTTKFKGPLTEKCNRDGGAGLTGNYVHHLKTYGNVHWSTNNSSATWTYDITGDGSTNLNDMMTDQETLSFQLISAQNNASYYMTQLKIDGSSSHTVFWSGGSAPTEGGASGYDVYTFTIFKRLNASFRIFASLSNHA